MPVVAPSTRISGFLLPLNREGKLRLDLQTNVLTIAEAGANAETLFRRFTCTP